MGWLQKLAKKARRDTPEAIAADVNGIIGQLRIDMVAAGEKAERNYKRAVERLKALSERSGVPVNDAKYRLLLENVGSLASKIKSAFDDISSVKAG